MLCVTHGKIFKCTVSLTHRHSYTHKQTCKHTQLHTQRPPPQTTLTSALQSGRVIVLSGLAITLVAAYSIQTEASFTHLLAKQGTFICICKQATHYMSKQSVMWLYRYCYWVLSTYSICISTMYSSIVISKHVKHTTYLTKTVATFVWDMCDVKFYRSRPVLPL